MDKNGKQSANPGDAYLVIRDGKKWSDVFRLIPGRTVTIGRSPTNMIVLREDQASRQHAEIFYSQGHWYVRDLGSRNGTAIGEDRLSGDHRLVPEDIVSIAGTQMTFAEDLAEAYQENSGKNRRGHKPMPPQETRIGLEFDGSAPKTPNSASGVTEPQTITHRRQRTRFIQPEDDADDGSEVNSGSGMAAARICRLAFSLANETTQRGIAKTAMDSLVKETQVDAGAVMLVPRHRRTTVDPEKLEILAWCSTERPEYQRVSTFLAETALRNGEAVLARDVQDDSAFGFRDAAGTIHATSVICAPIRLANRSVGLVHLYSTTQKVLNPEDLEFTLAVAETIAVAIRTRQREQKLVEDLSKTKNEIDFLRSQLSVESEIVGSSEAMLRVHQQIAKAAPSRATVLVRGESGVGKELVARAVHFSSDRKSGPFVCINCAALSETLLESELFGHERGAFTGATERKAGKFEAADKGTLMLDEIGEMSPSIQAKFLRVLEGHPFERVGGSRAIQVNARVIAATNRDLEASVREGTFRKDLFFRLHVVQIDVPPLRNRPEDVMQLSEHFLQKFKSETGRKIEGFSPQAVQQLKRYRWPGNVRELKNVIERAVVLASGSVIELDELILTKLTTNTESQFDFGTIVEPYHPQTLEEVERRHIEATLHSNAWNKSQSAKILGIERSTLDRKIKKFEITRDV